MEPFKNLLNAGVVAAAGAHLQRVWPAFERQRFEQLAVDGLDALEFKARAVHIAAALAACLPQDDFDVACTVLEASLAPRLEEGAEGGTTPRTSDAGLAGWIVWPMGEFVARFGLQHPERALAALHALTQRFTAEFAIRPLIAAHPDLAFATLARWVSDPSPHVRRLVSEGSRPRLPWGLRLQALVADPTPTLPLLEALQDDPSEYVRRSVANHLNDIAKDHPHRVADWIQAHLPGAPPARRTLLRHASRTLIKQGDACILALWGLGVPFDGEVAFSLSHTEVSVGDALALALHLQPRGSTTQALEIDYLVHHVKANGQSSPKVFKGWRLQLTAGEARALRKTHSLKPITTRRYHPGLHRVEVQINGRVVAEAAFVLRA
ncbi:MAG: DNA alkylation repair protein [Burkholderiales bacterium]